MDRTALGRIHKGHHEGAGTVMYPTIRDWIIAVTGYGVNNVYRTDQEGPRADGDYATYKIISSITAHWPIETREDFGSDDDVLRKFDYHRPFLVSINVFALDGYDVLDNLANSNDDYRNRQILTNGAGIELVGYRNEAQDRTGLGDHKFRQRYQATFEFRHFKQGTERNQKVLEIRVSGEIGGHADTAYYP